MQDLKCCGSKKDLNAATLTSSSENVDEETIYSYIYEPFICQEIEVASLKAIPIWKTANISGDQTRSYMLHV